MFLKPTKLTFSDIGNVIILENKDKQLGIEIALGSSTVFKQIYGLNHVMDCHPVLGLDNYVQNPNIRIRMEDSIVTGMVLYNDGLEPSNKDNACRLMKKYLEVLKNDMNKVNLQPAVLRKIIHQYEFLEYENNSGKYTQKIMNFILPQKQNQQEDINVFETLQEVKNPVNSFIIHANNKLSR